MASPPSAAAEGPPLSSWCRKQAAAGGAHARVQDRAVQGFRAMRWRLLHLWGAGQHSACTDRALGLAYPASCDILDGVLLLKQRPAVSWSCQLTDLLVCAVPAAGFMPCWVPCRAC